MDAALKAWRCPGCQVGFTRVFPSFFGGGEGFPFEKLANKSQGYLLVPPSASRLLRRLDLVFLKIGAPERMVYFLWLPRKACQKGGASFCILRTFATNMLPFSRSLKAEAFGESRNIFSTGTPSQVHLVRAMVILPVARMLLVVVAPKMDWSSNGTHPPGPERSTHTHTPRRSSQT